MENWWNDIDRGNAKDVENKNPIPVPLCQSPVPHGTA